MVEKSHKRQRNSVCSRSEKRGREIYLKTNALQF